jgi:release factor glutamine methyltransferase
VPANIAQTLQAATASLMGSAQSPRLEASLLLAAVLERPREYLIAHPEAALTPQQSATFGKLLRLWQKGMPTAYLLGSRPFYDRVFRVNPHVLIPRPETEHLVELALAWVRDKHNGQANIIDVGTGSGIIAVTLAAHLPAARVLATDVSAAALSVAQVNGAGLANLHFAGANLLSGEAVTTAAPFDLICANLPYIGSADMPILEVAKFEPLVALDGGADGLDLVRNLLAQAPRYLAQGGLLLLEIGADQGVAAAEAARAALPGLPVEVTRDYSGLDRVVRIGG